jgi:hypothetical protein
MVVDVLLLGCAAAFFPTLLAGVVVILSRPHPARLLLAFWAGGLTVSIAAGLLILHAFRGSSTIAGASKHELSPAIYLVGGGIAVVLAVLVGTPSGDRLRARWRERHPARAVRSPDRDPWAERILAKGSLPVAFAVGAVINLPGPYYLLALGEMAAASTPRTEAAVLVVAFNVLMFLSVELPLLGYVLRPEQTTVVVARFAAWLNRNGLRIVAVIVGGFGLVLLAKGLRIA